MQLAKRIYFYLSKVLGIFGCVLFLPFSCQMQAKIEGQALTALIIAACCVAPATLNGLVSFLIFLWEEDR